MRKPMRLDTNTVRSVARKTIRESFDQYGDGEGLGMTNLSFDNGLDNSYGRYDGYYMTNCCGRVKVTDYDGNVTIKGDGRHFDVIDGEDGLRVKREADRLVDTEGHTVEDAMSQAIANYLRNGNNTVRLTESQFITLIAETARRLLRENSYDRWRTSYPPEWDEPEWPSDLTDEETEELETIIHRIGVQGEEAGASSTRIQREQEKAIDSYLRGIGKN